jgi:excisionase family DNA binding protein
LYTRVEAAWILGVSVRTLDRLVEEGAVECLRLGGRLVRFRAEHLRGEMRKRGRLGEGPADELRGGKTEA